MRDTLIDLPVVTDDTGEVVHDWNDGIRSIRVVRGTWCLYQHGRLNTELDDTPRELLDISKQPLVSGWTCLLSASSEGAVELAGAKTGGWEVDVSSIELVSEKNLPDWAILR